MISPTTECNIILLLWPICVQYLEEGNESNGEKRELEEGINI